MENVFVSRPTIVGSDFEAGLTNFLAFLRSQGLEPRTLGYSDYPTDCPLDEVIALLRQCRGAVILGYPQIVVKSGSLREKRIPDDLAPLLLPTEWNHIEAALAYSMERPLLVIHHVGVQRGVFDHGATKSFIHQFDLKDPAWPLAVGAIGALQAWRDKALASGPLDAYPEKEVSPEYVKAIGLEKELAADGYRFVWGDLPELATAVEIEGYERIVWTDAAGKPWLLAARSYNQVPLKTRKSSQEIHAMREIRRG